MTAQAGAPKTPGASGPRRRLEGDREREVLAATLEVLAQVGYDRLTMDAVATKAKASKASLYRHWKGKVPLVIDALRQGYPHPVEPGSVDTGSLRGDLLAAYCGPGGLTDTPEVDTFGAVLTAIALDPVFADAFRSQVLAPKMAAVTALFERARRRGEIGEAVSIDLLSPALPGIVLLRSFLFAEVPSRELIAEVIDEIILKATT